MSSKSQKKKPEIPTPQELVLKVEKALSASFPNPMVIKEIVRNAAHVIAQQQVTIEQMGDDIRRLQLELS